MVNYRYDLKGSRVGRQADLEDREKPTAILKDLDYDELRGKNSMLVGPIRKEILMKQVRVQADHVCAYFGSGCTMKFVETRV